MIRTARTLSAALALLAGTAATAACVAQPNIIVGFDPVNSETLRQIMVLAHIW
jgi:hypothetical protein